MNVPGSRDHRPARRHPQLGDPHGAEADAHDRRLRPAAYGFNYYGTVGTNRDEFVIVRKMKKVDWLDRPHKDARRSWRSRMEAARMKIRAQIGWC